MRKGIGRIRLRLAQMIRDKGYDCDPEDLRSTNPAYMHPHWDCCCWEGHIGKHLHLVQCYDTMGDCVRNGFIIDIERSAIYALPKKKEAGNVG